MGAFMKRMPVCVVRLSQGRVGRWISNPARGYYVSTVKWIADIWNGMNRFPELDHLEESPKIDSIDFVRSVYQIMFRYQIVR